MAEEVRQSPASVERRQMARNGVGQQPAATAAGGMPRGRTLLKKAGWRYREGRYGQAAASRAKARPSLFALPMLARYRRSLYVQRGQAR